MKENGVQLERSGHGGQEYKVIFELHYNTENIELTREKILI